MHPQGDRCMHRSRLPCMHGSPLRGTDPRLPRAGARRRRAVVVGDVRGEAADDHDGIAGALRAREVGRGGDRVGGREDGGVQLAPAAVRAPAPVVERSQAGDADGGIELAEAPGAPEAVRDHDRRARAGHAREACPQRARGGVGVEREQDEDTVRGGVGLVDPGVRADEAVVRADDQDAALRAQQLGRLVEDRLHVTGILAVPRCEFERARGGGDLVQASQPALGFGDDLVGDHDDVAVGERVRGDQCREIVPGLDLGQSAQRARARSQRLQGGARARPRAREDGAQRGEVLGGVDVEQQAGQLDRAPRGAGRGGARAVALEAARAEARLDHRRRGEQQGVGALAVAVGDGGHRRGRRGGVQQRLDRVAVERRAVAGHQQHALVAVRDRLLDPDERGGALAGLVRIGAATARRRRRRAPRPGPRW